MKQTPSPKRNKPIRARGAVPEYSRLIARGRRRDSAIRRLVSFGIVR